VRPFATEQSIAVYATRFCDEPDAAEQNRMRMRLLAEEKRLGFGLEQLECADRQLGKVRELVARERGLVGRLEGRGNDTRLAIATLAALLEMQDLFERYRNLILDALDENRLSMPGHNGERSQPHGLTRREIEVLHHVAYGRSSRHIADLLGLSERTVSEHRDAICSKLGVATSARAVAAGFRAGVLTGASA
jgi:DNA-binding CsgD family transcriptional regulator